MPKNTGLFPGGTTSVHAENTDLAQRHYANRRNYLRARGEYWLAATSRIAAAELPPRTRRILDMVALWGGQIGTTSAHAENTRLDSTHSRHHQNYLRARGEYVVRRHAERL